MYVLSEKLIQFEYGNDDTGGLFTYFGLGIEWDCTYLIEGILQEIKYEKFDASLTTNFALMLNCCYK